MNPPLVDDTMCVLRSAFVIAWTRSLGRTTQKFTNQQLFAMYLWGYAGIVLAVIFSLLLFLFGPVGIMCLAMTGTMGAFSVLLFQLGSVLVPCGIAVIPWAVIVPLCLVFLVLPAGGTVFIGAGALVSVVGLVFSGWLCFWSVYAAVVGHQRRGFCCLKKEKFNDEAPPAV